MKISPIAKPDDIRFTDVLPKTRSGKIMRRILRSLASGQTITGDTSTLEDATHRCWNGCEVGDRRSPWSWDPAASPGFIPV